MQRNSSFPGDWAHALGIPLSPKGPGKVLGFGCCCPQHTLSCTRPSKPLGPREGRKKRTQNVGMRKASETTQSIYLLLHKERQVYKTTCKRSHRKATRSWPWTRMLHPVPFLCLLPQRVGGPPGSRAQKGRRP